MIIHMWSACRDFRPGDPCHSALFTCPTCQILAALTLCVERGVPPNEEDARPPRPVRLGHEVPR